MRVEVVDAAPGEVDADLLAAAAFKGESSGAVAAQQIAKRLAYEHAAAP